MQRGRVATKGGLTRVIAILPFMLPVALAAFSGVAMILLLLNTYTLALVLPLGSVAAIVSAVFFYRWYPFGDIEDATKKSLLIDLLAIFMVIVWIGFNSLYTAQHLFTNRDPATYTEASVWLATHDSLKIDATQGFDIPGVSPDSAGFPQDPSHPQFLQAQAQHLLPALLGLIGKVVGVKAMLHFNVVFGGLALLALYGLIRLFAGRVWGIVGLLAFGCSLPLMYFSRDIYTEPLSAVFVLESLATIFIAQRSKTNQAKLWVVAGFVTSAGALTRIDVYLSILGLLAFAVIAVAVSFGRKRQIGSVASYVLFIASMVPLCIVGWLDLKLLSSVYYQAQATYYHLEIAAAVALLVVGACVGLIAWKTTLLRTAYAKVWRYAPWVVALIVILIAAFLVSRPLWYVQRESEGNGLVAGLQAAEGLKVDPTRQYGELSMNWLAWYGGVSMVVLGLVGAAIAAKRAMHEESLRYLPPLAVLFGAMLFYTMKPLITPDQIWAARRFLPVVIPGLIFFSIIALQRVAPAVSKRNGERAGLVIASVGAALLVIQPFYTSQPFLRLRVQTGQVQRIDDVCSNLPSNAAVLWLGTGRTQAIQPTKEFCHVAVVGYGPLFSKDRPEQSTLQQFSTQAHRMGLVPYVAVYGSEVSLLSEHDVADLKEVNVTNNVRDIKQTLTRKPSEIISGGESILIGQVGQRGRIVQP